MYIHICRNDINYNNIGIDNCQIDISNHRYKYIILIYPNTVVIYYITLIYKLSINHEYTYHKYTHESLKSLPE